MPFFDLTLKSVRLKNLSVFSEASFHFSPQLNVVIGENATGKSHFLKTIYSVLAVSAEKRRPNSGPPTKTLLQARIAEKLLAVLRPEALGRIVRRRQGRERCEIEFAFRHQPLNIGFNFATMSKSEVNIEKQPTVWLWKSPVFLPTRELLTIFPNFISVYDNHYLELDETWRDTCVLLGAPALRGPKEERIRKLLSPLEQVMGGKIELDTNGRFYLRISGQGRMEMSLVAEGWGKLAMLARLISTGSLVDKGYLFWDEPEANLNPRLIKKVAAAIMELCKNGIQVFVATHSLFLLREFEILLQKSTFRRVSTKFFGLQPGEDGVIVQQGKTIDDIGPITSLDEELSQSDRYLETE
ncbi:MAG: AAA family ATPase [Deltaproteobacteria bacterium]|jgi:energy-coupling factor transporter ATP-binding protein EcfA2|nr:AAA family ATPase [Deltaproteobacteria bacterium]